MNKKFAYIGIALMALVGMSSCSDEDVFSPREVKATFTLTMPGQDVMTRATDPGLDAFNENDVETVDLFFYHTGATNQNAVFRKTLKASEIALNNTSTNTTTGMYVYDLTSSISITELRTIFPNYDTEGATYSCVVYAIVNLPEDAEITDTDIESLKQVELTCSTFSELTAATNASFKKGVIPDNFVMSGQSSTITLDTNNKRNLVGNIDVFRSASKVTLELTGVSSEFTDANEHVWNSQTENITVGLKHGQTVGYVEEELHNVSGDFTTKNIHMIPGTWISGGTSTGHYKTDVPMYTYPNDWSNDLSHRSSLLVCVWWRDTSVEGSSYQPTYYEIPISDEDEKILRNYHYRIQLSIGIIGSLVEEEPVVLDHCSYVILPWGRNETILADMNQVRYLVVDETEIHMDNIIARSINYSSSHNILVTNKQLYVNNLEGNSATWSELSENAFRVVVVNPTEGGGTSYFTVEHDLNNNMKADGDYTMFRMEFDVYHYDEDPTDTKYIEHIVVYQTPMIYAEAEQNSRYPQTSNNNVFVNGGTDNYGGVHGLTGGNKNPNRYIIRATALTSDKFVIGDPRLAVVNNALTGTNVTTASTAVDTWATYVQSNLYNTGKTRYNRWGNQANNGNYYRLQFYHPTEESNRTLNMISPQYMIASSYGVTTAINKQNARRRCASYQEDGYPAGRWRLPTAAEVEYTVQLSAWKKIPILFGELSSSTTYWSANGSVTVTYDAAGNGTVTTSTTANTNSTYYVRCVYDTWYWTDKCNPITTFTWGDKQDF